jgi:hypothetical protein
MIRKRKNDWSAHRILYDFLRRNLYFAGRSVSRTRSEAKRLEGETTYTIVVLDRMDIFYPFHELL